LNNRRDRSTQRGFTLVEMMAVVTITGILATLAWFSLRKYMLRSRIGEAQTTISAARVGLIGYMAENHVYLNVSTDSGGLAWYPRQTPNKSMTTWRAPSHPDYARWMRLGAPVESSVRFSYLVNAGVVGTSYPVTQVPGAVFPSGTQTRDWYVIQAKGDTNGDGVFATCAATSASGELFCNTED
jgi:prepilin-type N-terminal cleavage/methylation domain-containing protein